MAPATKDLIEITFVSNKGGGTVQPMRIERGTTVGKFFADMTGEESTSRHRITVDRVEADVNDVLKAGAFVSITPTDVRGS